MSRLDETLALDRRRFLCAALGGGAVLAVGSGWLVPRLFAASSVALGKPGDVLLEIFADDGRDLGPRQVPKLVLTDAQWRQRLSPLAFDVMRRGGTERAFSGDHEKPATKGLFRCVGCNTALYDAATEFDSGTGWPSFRQPIARSNVIPIHDSSFGWKRTAISCAGMNTYATTGCRTTTLPTMQGRCE
ncbi:MAG: peptide-methionine (R)-S-oxide reductase [Rhodanobacter sp.]